MPSRTNFEIRSLVCTPHLQDRAKAFEVDAQSELLSTMQETTM
jgi:hypothetical protein